MRHINGAYTTYFNIKRRSSGHLLQGRYKSNLVERDEYAKELWRYIHLNPAGANMVTAPEAFKWRSYNQNQFIGTDKAEQWHVRDFILGYFGKEKMEAAAEPMAIGRFKEESGQPLDAPAIHQREY